MIGIIAEYNPFHNGHLYHLKKVKELFPNKVITLVLVGHFLNRGEISIINKWDKTKLALEYGIDLIVELPFFFAVQSADYYAYGGIAILDHLKADYLVFGSEVGDIEYLKKIASLKPKLDLLKENTKKGYNYPTTLAKALNLTIDTPNDLLAVSYIKAIMKLNSKIEPICIKRTNDYHSKELTGLITSATSIRESIKQNKDISSYVPDQTLKYLKPLSLDDYFPFLKHQIIIDDLTKYVDIDECLANRLKKCIMDSNNLKELITKVKTKNYTYNKISRCLVHILTGLLKDNYDITYIRVLGFNKKGQKYLRKIKKELTIPLLTNYNDSLKLEMQATKVYSLLSEDDIVKQELNKPIIHD